MGCSEKNHPIFFNHPILFCNVLSAQNEILHALGSEWVANSQMQR